MNLEVPLCKGHQTPLFIFCSSCDVIICRKCVPSEHNECSVRIMKNFFENFEHEALDSIQQCKAHQLMKAKGASAKLFDLESKIEHTKDFFLSVKEMMEQFVKQKTEVNEFIHLVDKRVKNLNEVIKDADELETTEDRANILLKNWKKIEDSSNDDLKVPDSEPPFMWALVEPFLNSRIEVNKKNFTAAFTSMMSEGIHGSFNEGYQKDTAESDIELETEEVKLDHEGIWVINSNKVATAAMKVLNGCDRPLKVQLQDHGNWTEETLMDFLIVLRNTKCEVEINWMDCTGTHDQSVKLTEKRLKHLLEGTVRSSVKYSGHISEVILKSLESKQGSIDEVIIGGANDVELIKNILRGSPNSRNTTWKITKVEEHILQRGPKLLSLMTIGTRVKRGIDWNRGNEDYNSVGVVTAVNGQNVSVRWNPHNVQRNNYRMGIDGKYDLQLDNTSRCAVQVYKCFVRRSTNVDCLGQLTEAFGQKDKQDLNLQMRFCSIRDCDLTWMLAVLDKLFTDEFSHLKYIVLDNCRLTQQGFDTLFGRMYDRSMNCGLKAINASYDKNGSKHFTAEQKTQIEEKFSRVTSQFAMKWL